MCPRPELRYHVNVYTDYTRGFVEENYWSPFQGEFQHIHYAMG